MSAGLTWLRLSPDTAGRRSSFPTVPSKPNWDHWARQLLIGLQGAPGVYEGPLPEFRSASALKSAGRLYPCPYCGPQRSYCDDALLIKSWSGTTIGTRSRGLDTVGICDTAISALDRVWTDRLLCPRTAAKKEGKVAVVVITVPAAVEGIVPVPTGPSICPLELTYSGGSSTKSTE